jgi:hypothetical protein
MDKELERAYDALMQADAAGNKEDAQQIADYIRTLETQKGVPGGETSVKQVSDADLINVLTPTIGGAIAGEVVGPIVNKGAEAVQASKAPTTTAPAARAAGTPFNPRGVTIEQSVQNWENYGQAQNEAAKRVRREAELHKKYPGFTRAQPPAPAATPSAMSQLRQAIPGPIKTAGQFLGGAAQSGVVPWLGRAVAGGAAGYQGADAYNRLRQGDVVGGGLSAIGTLGAGASFFPHPVTRYGGAAISAGAEGLNQYLDYLKRKSQQPAAAQPQQEEQMPVPMKQGGLVHLAKGKAVSDALKKFNFDKFKMSEVYPDVIPPVMATDAKTGKQFLQKQLSPEAIDVQKARKLAQKEIDLGRYEPFFDIEKRFYADPSRYQLAGTTLTDIVPKKADTIAKYEQLANQPESLLRLRGAFDVAKDRPLAKDWYAMGQLENEFIRELGPVEGPKQFRARFADAMAATTGGADPNSNLMMSAFTNYQKGLGKEIPTTAADLPFPIGGRFVSGNMEQAKKLQDLGLIPVTNPKRHNFSANFLGYRDRSTLDEQMSQLWDPKMMAPPPNAYGIYEQALAKEAKRAGVEPANFQDIAWAGAKNYPGKPMIREINEMLARTNMITGEPQEEILKGFIKGNKPMYGIAGAGAGVSLDDEEKANGGLVGYKEGGSTTPAWQRSEGKSPSGGLNALGRASYKRETGGELKAPQPEGGSRKKSFCARMGGMKKKLTSSKTANDPDSRINKALRKWKC